MDQHLVPAPDSNLRRANRFRARSLEVAGLGLAASAIPQSAAATIISELVDYSPTTTFSLDGISPDGDIELISMVGNMGLDISLSDKDGTVDFAVSPTGGMGSIDWLTLLFSGDTVDGNLTTADDGFLVRSDAVNPQWDGVTLGYAGFEFDLGGTTVYGWLQVEFDNTTFSVVQWAFQDNGDPIQVGVIPEPSTAILFGLGLAGLAGVFRRRLRSRLPVDTH